jgi:hypothetical protein
VRKATLILRKARHGVRLNEHLDGLTVVFQHACKMGLEGIVSKRLGSRYRSGRSLDWLKFKNPEGPAVRREAEDSVSQESRRGISTSAHANAAASATLANSPIRGKPLNVESFDRPIRAHKKKGNHPGSVVVDVQYPCHTTPTPPLTWGSIVP